MQDPAIARVNACNETVPHDRVRGRPMKITMITSLLMDYVGGRLMPIAMDKIRSCPPYGVYMLAEVLRQEGHEVTVVDLVAQGSLSLASYEQTIKDSHLIGISATSLSWPAALDMIVAIKQRYPKIPIVLGGIHATMFDDYILSSFPVEYIIRGEGELALPRLADAIAKGGELRDVPSLSMMADGHVVRTPLAPPVTEAQMCSLPMPDYESIPLSSYKGVALESSRGCPFSCSFCSTSYRRSWRGISPEVFVERVEYLRPYSRSTEYGCIHVIDDEFSANWKRAKSIARLLSKRGNDVGLVFDSRANDILHEDFVEAIAPHTHHFLVGAECGYDEGLARVGKGTTCAKLEQAASVMLKHGISHRCDFSFILGLPWETKDDVLKTMSFACHLYANYGVNVMLQWYCLIPGSSLWAEEMEKGVINVSYYDNYGFFRSPELFFAGVKLSAKEVWEVSDAIGSVMRLASVNDRGEERIHYSTPEAVKAYYGKNALSDRYSSALVNLKELSQNARPQPWRA